MIYLRQSTASQEIPLGSFVDSGDGNTQETSLTIASTDIKLWKAGASSEVAKNSGGATHMANGRYVATLDETDTNTLGSLTVFVHVSGALAVKQECVVLPAFVYDALIAGTTPTVDGVESDIFAMVVQVWRRFFKQTESDRANGTIKTFADNGSTVLTTQTVTKSGDTTTVGAAS